MTLALSSTLCMSLRTTASAIWSPLASICLTSSSWGYIGLQFHRSGRRGGRNFERCSLLGQVRRNRRDGRVAISHASNPLLRLIPRELIRQATTILRSSFDGWRTI
ncbi:hypothetical protein EDB89DRAFT_322822 [Lactarius sanguifluus]|nr:hypothetical protein EDB89DRAFT_322822 [Lactarius sanguifluus]